MSRVVVWNKSENKTMFFEAIVTVKLFGKAVSPLELMMTSSLSNTLHDQLSSGRELQDRSYTIPFPGILPLPLGEGLLRC